MREIDETLARCEELLPGVVNRLQARMRFTVNRDDETAEPDAVESALLLEQTIQRLAPPGSMYLIRMENAADGRMPATPSRPRRGGASSTGRSSKPSISTSNAARSSPSARRSGPSSSQVSSTSRPTSSRGDTLRPRL